MCHLYLTFTEYAQNHLRIFISLWFLSSLHISLYQRLYSTNANIESKLIWWFGFHFDSPLPLLASLLSWTFQEGGLDRRGWWLRPEQERLLINQPCEDQVGLEVIWFWNIFTDDRKHSWHLLEDYNLEDLKERIILLPRKVGRTRYQRLPVRRSSGQRCPPGRWPPPSHTWTNSYVWKSVSILTWAQKQKCHWRLNQSQIISQWEGDPDWTIWIGKQSSLYLSDLNVNTRQPKN